MDEEYVQEHILTGGIVAPVGAPRRLIHGRLQPFRSALSRHTRHICGVLRAPRMRGPRCGWLRASRPARRARLLVGGLHQTVADAAMLGALTDCENIGCAGNEMIVDDDAAIDRDTGLSGDFGVRLDADHNNDCVGRKHVAVLELCTPVKCRSRALRQPAPTKAARDCRQAAALHRSPRRHNGRAHAGRALRTSRQPPCRCQR